MSQFLDSMGPLGPIILLGALGLALVIGAAVLMLKAPKDPYAKLQEAAKVQASSAKNKQKLRYDNGADKLEKYSKFLEPQDEEEFSAIRLKMIQAGYRGKNAVRTYHFAQFALGLGLLAAGVLVVLVQSQGEDPSIQQIFMTALLPAIVGYMLPKYWVTKRLQSRQEEISNGFPDSLDLMLVCVEAGQSLDQSIIRVSEEMRSSFPALAEEFMMVAHEMKAGKEKTAVLRDMAERAGVPDVASFVTVLIQSQQFGTSIAEALRVYAGEMRDKRVMRAEEKANKLPTKMTLATMMLTVPPLLIIMIGPSIYEIYTQLNNR
ncbi:MAG: type II secretion system F family protein [Pseudomonadota bacterium]